LNAGTRGRVRIQKAAAEAHGQLEPSSDHTFRLLTRGPSLITAPGLARVTHWGGQKDPSGRVAVIKRGAEEVPESRQLRDPFSTFYVQGIALEPPLPLDRLLNLTEDNALHAACLMAKATDACGRGWGFEPKEGQEADKTLIESDLPNKLKEAVSALCVDLTFSEMLYQGAWEMLALGQGVWEVVREDAAPGQYGKVAALYPIPAHTIRASLDPRKWVQIRAGRVRYFKKFGAQCTINNETGTVYEWQTKKGNAAKAQIQAAKDLDPNAVASELIIFKEWTPRSLWYGMPKWVSAVPTIAEMSAIREFNVSWFASGGQVDFHIHAKANSDQAAQEIKAQIQQQIEENKGRGHTLLVTAGTVDTEVKAEKLGELLREGHFRFRRGDLAKEILIAHCVPPYRVGWAETGSLGGNAAEEMLGAYKFGAIEPIQVVIEERLARTLFNPELGGIKTGEFALKLTDLEYDTDETDKILNQTKFGVLTPNQAREALGHEVDEEHEELDAYYFNGQPLGQQPMVPGMESGDGSNAVDGLFPDSGEEGPDQGNDAAEADADSQLPGATPPNPGAQQMRGPRKGKRKALAPRGGLRYAIQKGPEARFVSMVERLEKTIAAALADEAPRRGKRIQPPVGTDTGTDGTPQAA
jgi:hypothetical protein